MGQNVGVRPRKEPYVSASITVIRPDARETRTFETTTTGLDVFGDDRTVVAMRVDGEILDLHRELPDGSELAPVLVSEPDGLYILRHSAAHVAAQAVQNLRADAKLGIGPPVVDGFYYDFLTEPLTPEDLKALEKDMRRIVKERQRFVRRVVGDDEARVELASEPFWSHLIL